MDNDKPREGMFAAIIRLISTILEFFSNRKQQQGEEQKQQNVEKAKEELRKALAEGRMQDAAYWRKKLLLLSGSLALALILAIGTTGCLTTQPPPAPPVFVLGDRVHKVQPGQAIVVPPLMPPAKQFYLVDDVGLFQWLDIDLSSPK